MYYPRIDEKVDAALKALRALRDELLLELYDRHQIPQEDRESFGTDVEKTGASGKTIANPLPELQKNYTELAEILKKERDKYVVPLLDAYDSLAKIRKELDKPKKLAPSYVQDLITAEQAAGEVLNLKLAKYTLPKDATRFLGNQCKKLKWIVAMNIAGKREEIKITGEGEGEGKSEDEGAGKDKGKGKVESGDGSKGEGEGGDGSKSEGESGGEGEDGSPTEPPPTHLMGKSKLFYDAMLGAYDRFVDAIVKNLHNTLISEPLPEKPVLRTFEQIAEDDLKEAKEKKKSEGGK
jgi:hypothetical protein